MVVYDTYAWIEYFRGTDKGKEVKAFLKNGGYTPSIVLAEIARKYLREEIPISEVEKRLSFIEIKTKIAYIDSETSLKSGETYLELYKYAKKNNLRTPSLADAIVYAVSKMLEEELVTGDKLFKNLPNIIYIGD